MGSAGRWTVRRLGVVLVIAACGAACNRGRPVLEYDDTVTTVETAEPVAQRGLDHGGAPPPMVKMPGEEGGTAITPRPPSKMIMAEDAPLEAAAAGGEMPFPVDDDPPTSVVPVPGGAGGSRAVRSTTRDSSQPVGDGTTPVLGGGEPATASAGGDPDVVAPATAGSEAAVLPAAAAGVQSDAEPDAEARAEGRVDLAPTPEQAAEEALPKTGTAVRTTQPWQKAAPWN